MRGRSFVLLAALLLVAIVPASVQAERPAMAGPAAKVTICHRTGSSTNPWVKITISSQAWKAHEKHGDFVVTANRPCPPRTTTTTSMSATTTIGTTGAVSVVTVRTTVTVVVVTVSTVTTTRTVTPTTIATVVV